MKKSSRASAWQAWCTPAWHGAGDAGSSTRMAIGTGRQLQPQRPTRCARGVRPGGCAHAAQAVHAMRRRTLQLAGAAVGAQRVLAVGVDGASRGKVAGIHRSDHVANVSTDVQIACKIMCRLVVARLCTLLGCRCITAGSGGEWRRRPFGSCGGTVHRQQRAAHGARCARFAACIVSMRSGSSDGAAQVVQAAW